MADFSEFLSAVLLLSLLVLFLLAYFLPAILAFRNEHPHAIAIAAANFLFGWTLLGWGGALVWSMLHRRPVRGTVLATDGPSVQLRKAGELYWRGDTERAMEMLSNLIDRYPNTSAAIQADSLLKQWESRRR